MTRGSRILAVPPDGFRRDAFGVDSDSAVSTQAFPRRKPELLAPAADLAAALTAFDCGADAVYAGLKHFSARSRSRNFEIDEMARLAAYASSIGKKTYAAFNTLLKESELEEAARSLAALASAGVDAVIVQDLGALRMTRNYFPTLSIHASTQMGCHNVAGAQALARLGVSRIILERQTTLSEVEAIAKASPVEIEVFVHGALCCSLSGNCLFSSWIGGTSGNRGQCRQPCRHAFVRPDGSKWHPFSTRDLCMADSIGSLRNAGVASLKIEGRLRKADYVRNVVSAYRAMLDAAPGAEAEALEKSMAVLRNSFGREFFHGFKSDSDFQGAVRNAASGASGQFRGRVLRADAAGIVVRLAGKLHVGDRVSLVFDDGSDAESVTVTKMFWKGRQVMEAGRGDEPLLPLEGFPAMEGAGVYKIGEQSPDLASRIARLPQLRPMAVDVKVSISLGKIQAEARFEGTGVPFSWASDAPASEAVSRPLSSESVSEEFAKTRSPALSAGKISADTAPNLFLSVGELKRLRREFWVAVGLAAPRNPRQAAVADGLARLLSEKPGKPEKPQAPRRTALLTSAHPPDGFSSCGILGPRLDGFDEALLPIFCPEGQVKTVAAWIRKAFDAGLRRFRVPHLYGLELLRDFPGVELTASTPLPCCNSMAAAELLSMGFSTAQAWIELDAPETDTLAKRSPIALEAYRFGRPAVLSTRARLDTPKEPTTKRAQPRPNPRSDFEKKLTRTRKGDASKEVCDCRGTRWRIVPDPWGFGITCLLADLPVRFPAIPGAGEFQDLLHADPSERGGSVFNLRRPWA